MSKHKRGSKKMNKYKRNSKEMFNGTVDQFLEHCSKMDVEAVSRQVDAANYEECIRYIMCEAECDRVEAHEIYDAIRLKEVSDAVANLLELGLIEIVGYNDDGEPLYGPTNKM